MVVIIFVEIFTFRIVIMQYLGYFDVNYIIYENFDKYPIGMWNVLETLNMSKVYEEPSGGF